jgi:4'-phosphopantetheinyl transferase
MLKNINPEEIYIFHKRLSMISDDINNLVDMLSPSEVSRADQFKSEDSRLLFITSRALLRQFLSSYTSIQPNTIRINTTPSGKPFINSELKFNLSHSGNMIVYSFCLNSEIGIDTEEINPSIDHLDIGKHVFTEAELCYLRKAADQEQLNDRFFRIWTRKEAVVKAEGTGLLPELKTIDVLNDLVSKSSLTPGIHWRLTDIDISSGFKTALAHSFNLNKLIIKQV